MDTPGSAPDHRPATILVVEDDPAIRELVHEALRPEGFRVVAATNHADALTALTSLRFGLVLTDTAGASVVASGDPWADLDALRHAVGDVPTIIFSAHSPTLFDGWRVRGFAGFVAKPFDVEALVATVSAALSRQPVASGCV